LCKLRQVTIQGKVSIDGKIVTAVEKNITPSNRVAIENRIILPPPPRLLLHYKRPGVLVTHGEDAKGRPTLFQILQEVGINGFNAVGRLDFGTEGLIILTNDGDLARHLELPSSGLERVYEVHVKGVVLTHFHLLLYLLMLNLLFR